MWCKPYDMASGVTQKECHGLVSLELARQVAIEVQDFAGQMLHKFNAQFDSDNIHAHCNNFFHTESSVDVK